MAAESTFAVLSAAVFVVAVLISACCRSGCRCSYHDTGVETNIFNPLAWGLVALKNYSPVSKNRRKYKIKTALCSMLGPM